MFIEHIHHILRRELRGMKNELLAYHLGQIDYHQRCATGDATTAGALSPRDLKSAAD